MRLLLFLLAVDFGVASAQPPSGIEWSDTRRLVMDDFKGPAPIENYNIRLSFGSSFDVKANEPNQHEHFNALVTHTFIGEQSWINWTKGNQLLFANTLFDIHEWHARELRKQLWLNKRQVQRGDFISIVDKVHKDFEALADSYGNETSQAEIAVSQMMWETKIRDHLAQLSDFCKTCVPPKR